MPTPDVADQAGCSQPVTAVGSPISGPLASLIDKIIDKTMEDNKRKDLADKYPVPENVTKLNPSKRFKLRAMVPIMQLIDSSVAGRDCHESLNSDELVTKLVDAVALTALGNANANAFRRESIKRDLNEENQAICSNTNPQMLFGKNITDQLKSITESNKIGFKINTSHERPYLPEIRLFFRTTAVSTALSSNTEGGGISSRRTAQGSFLCDSQTTCKTLTSTCIVAETHVRETKLNSKVKMVLDGEIKSLLLKGVTETAQHCDGEFISTVPKSTGSYSLILNLKSLNESVEYIHFKMESLHAAVRLITPGCFMALIDLKDAYYTVNVSEEFRKYLRFIWRGQLYQYTCLANGLACAPRKFTKLSSLFSVCGVFGWLVLIRHYVRGVSRKSFCHTRVACRYKFRYKQREIVMGKIISCSIAIPYGILYTNVLEQDKTSALKYNKGNIDSHMKLSVESLNDLDWKLRAVKKSRAPLYRDIPVISLTTDASNGWERSGQWAIEEASFKENINYLGLNSVLLGLKAYTSYLR
ncbi:LOW QUALITY PROTEIN: hypothetical protein MAR_007446 [Mya arenaria]|uniref:Reverse transcriptase domain-containing protein n=1 Tax=Mya arenaria TaxID=6604 RepID=A0ABY7DF49_MYAAR|nr:LOW QUALITY PROTEIN: hypothetical protein MAR_007446 [Mya arenaria]